MKKNLFLRFRTAVQAAATLIQNAHFAGFFTGKIYQGPLKTICVPGLNCYSCPGAVGSCPIGSLQNTLSSYRFKFPYYVLGLLIFFGAILGRFICGFLCPFGFLQDLLHQIPFPKKIRTFPGDRMLRKLKYVILIVMVIILPISVKLTPFFCKYLCPSGTVSGILLAFSDSKLFAVLGSQFMWKVSVLVMILLASIIIARPFCRYLCPLGAFYAPFNHFSVVQMEVHKGKCTHCGSCSHQCPMTVDPSSSPNHSECIRCGKCISVCPEEALKFSSILKKSSSEQRS